MKPRPSRHATFSMRSVLATAVITAVTAVSHAASSFPDYPLQTGTRSIPPNIMFILDDSGSMTWRYMYNPDIPGITYYDSEGSAQTSGPTGDNIRKDAGYGPFDASYALAYDRTYVTNTVYYNPHITYTAWMNANGTRLPGGTTYSSAFADANLASSPINLFAQGTATYYVPKSEGLTDAQLGQLVNYYRFQILTDGRVVRAEYTNGSGSSAWVDLFNASVSLAKGGSTEYTVVVPDDAVELEVTLGGDKRSADLYVRNPGNTAWTCSQTGNDDNVCSITSSLGTGPRRIRIEAEKSFSSYPLVVRYKRSGAALGCSSSTSGWDWRNCVETTPTGRSPEQERNNFATWYSYHRTRMKAAKAGASEAFGSLGENFRVGYDSLWNGQAVGQRSWTSAMLTAAPSLPIPVKGNDSGLFKGGNRTSWFSAVQNAAGNDGTPLRAALARVGNYYETATADSGPWGPQQGSAQLSCRQSYAILTTDGYWNTDSVDVGNVDNKTGESIKTADGTSSYQYQPGIPYKDAYSNTLADVAMHYWARDLRDLPNNVPASNSDPAFWQHMVTFGISIGLKGTVDPANAGAVAAWPNPTDGEDLERIDDLLHASVNGRGRFVAASSPKVFSDALLASLATIQSRRASGSNVASNGPALEAGSRIYQATYTSGEWSGDVSALPIGSQSIEQRVWSAADMANKGEADFLKRRVLTWAKGKAETFPTDDQLASLGRTTGIAPVSAADNAAYIKGNRSLEVAKGAGKLRNRASPIGDIVNSSPVYVNTGAAATLYVGANDGMLHGIDAASGTTVFSYVPAGVKLADLANLSNPEYDHRFFVDGGIDFATSEGRTVLVGALGRGGKGVFALDVTDPASQTPLWDQTAANDDDMGYVLGAPLVLPGEGGSTLTFVGNGIESGSSSANREAVLFVYVTGANGKLTNTYKLRTGVKGDNGLAEPRAADVDGDGVVDYVYAGDLRGNVWKFDVTGAPNTWEGNTVTRLFTAIGPDGKAQAITGAVALAREPVTRRLFVVFGTGRYISNDDISGAEATRVQSVYGLIDSGATIADRTQLQERTIVKTGKDSKGRNARAWEPYAPLGADKKGWFVDLNKPTAGERVVTRPLIVGRAMWFSSIIPTAGTGCESGGTGYLNAVDAFTGTNPSRSSSGGGTYTFIDVDNNRKGDDKLAGEPAAGDAGFVTSVDVGVGMPGRGTNVGEGIYVCGSDGSCGWVPIPPKPAVARRVGWREVVGGN